MNPQLGPSDNAVAPAGAPGPSDQLLRRIRGEFTEMPGMRLTMKQAQRLWGLEALTCEATLQHLVDTRFLATDGQWYSRRTEGASIGVASH